jgi:hypothetical protein
MIIFNLNITKKHFLRFFIVIICTCGPRYSRFQLFADLKITKNIENRGKTVDLVFMS